MVCQEINWRYQAHHCELLEGNIEPTRCFQCYKFGHITKHCRLMARCGFCAKSGHESNDCDVKDDPAAHRCANCRDNHTAWHSDYHIVATGRKRSQAAYDNRSVRYRVDSPHRQPLGNTFSTTTYFPAIAATLAPTKEHASCEGLVASCIRTNYAHVMGRRQSVQCQCSFVVQRESTTERSRTEVLLLLEIRVRHR